MESSKYKSLSEFLSEHLITDDEINDGFISTKILHIEGDEKEYKAYSNLYYLVASNYRDELLKLKPIININKIIQIIFQIAILVFMIIPGIKKGMVLNMFYLTGMIYFLLKFLIFFKQNGFKFKLEDVEEEYLNRLKEVLNESEKNIREQINVLSKKSSLHIYKEFVFRDYIKNNSSVFRVLFAIKKAVRILFFIFLLSPFYQEFFMKNMWIVFGINISLSLTITLLMFVIKRFIILKRGSYGK